MSGCSTTTPAKNVNIQNTEKLLSEIWIEGVYDKSTALEALRLATITNYIPHQWRATLALCQNELVYCDEAINLAQQNDADANAIFETYIAIFANHQQERALLSMERYAKSSSQRTLVSILKGDQTSLANLDLTASERALALYQIGKYQQNRQTLINASKAFYALQNLRGSADATFLAAKIALSEGDKESARRLAYQSKQYLQAILEHDLVSHIDEWMEANL
jgi:hypothetical protein